MHRTTILLPEELWLRAEREAGARGVSVAELIRQCLAEAVGPGSPRPAFFDREPWRGSAPADLAAGHDRYLYGEGDG